VLILEVDYGFEFRSHPELRSSERPITRSGAKRLVKAAGHHGIRVIPEFQSFGHQSWAKETFTLLTRYPVLDSTPGAFPQNEGIYCREWDPMNPRVYQIVYALLDYGEWESSKNGTSPAIDRIPKDIVICDWHYEPRESYPSVPMFLEKGFRVLPTSWKDVAASKALIGYSLGLGQSGVLGHLFTSWSKPDKLAEWPPLVENAPLVTNRRGASPAATAPGRAR